MSVNKADEGQAAWAFWWSCFTKDVLLVKLVKNLGGQNTAYAGLSRPARLKNKVLIHW